ncbi:MAG: hypothetical protein ACKN9V_09140 [Pseudomonadota bacterium]
MKFFYPLLFLAQSISFSQEKTIQLLVPQKKGATNAVVKVTYQVQHPLLACSTLRALPFPGVRQLIVDGKVSKTVYISNEGVLFEAVHFPFSKTERKRVLQKISLGGSEGVSGDCLPLTEKARDELTTYLGAKYQEELSAEGVFKTVYLLQQKKTFGFDKLQACAFLRASEKSILEKELLTPPELALILKSYCKMGSG